MERIFKGRMVPVKTFLVAVLLLGLIQIFLLLQMNYTYLRPAPNQCDCQCTKQLHISASGHSVSNSNYEELQVAVENTKNGQKPQPEKGEGQAKSNEEKKLKKILEAEDKALDKKFEANKTNVEEDPEEKSPYQPEKLGGKDTRKPYERLIPGPLIINPLINASKFQCSPPTENILLIYVYTAPQNFGKRERIRKAPGSVGEYKGIRVRVLFFIGNLTEQNHKKLYQQLLNESRIYGDLVQDQGYYDAYRNLSLKGLSALRWINEYCPSTYRVMKIDDDTQVNPYNLITFLEGQSKVTMSEIICKVTQGVGPIRNPKSKYHVSVAEYKETYYPPYCQGYGYILPPFAIKAIAKNYNSSRIIAMEDVYITGITAQSLGIRLHPLTAMFATTFTRFELFLERITTRPDLLLIGHVHEERYVEIFWHLVEQRHNMKKRAEAKKKAEEERAKMLEKQKQHEEQLYDEDENLSDE